MSWTRAERELIEEARLLEERRIDLLVRAAESRVVDMMPSTWLNMEQNPDDDFVEITFASALTTADVRLMKARELRELALWTAGIAEEARLRRAMESEESDE